MNAAKGIQQGRCFDFGRYGVTDACGSSEPMKCCPPKFIHHETIVGYGLPLYVGTIIVPFSLLQPRHSYLSPCHPDIKRIFPFPSKLHNMTRAHAFRRDLVDPALLTGVHIRSVQIFLERSSCSHDQVAPQLTSIDRSKSRSIPPGYLVKV